VSVVHIMAGSLANGKGVVWKGSTADIADEDLSRHPIRPHPRNSAAQDISANASALVKLDRPRKALYHARQAVR